MSYVLQDHLDLIDDLRIDTSSDTVDLDSEGLRAINRTIRELKKHDWPFLIDKVKFDYYNTVREYPLDSNFDGLIGLYELDNYRDPFRMISPTGFDRIMNQYSSEDLISVDYKGRKHVLKVNFVNTKSNYTTVIENSSYDGNGTWVGSGTASEVATDDETYSENTGCVRFKSTGSGTAILTNSTITSVDLSSYGYDYANRLRFELPEAGYLTSVTLKWGSDSSNYHEVQHTNQFNGLAFQSGQNEVLFKKTDSTDTGTPDDSALGYIVIEFVCSGTMNPIRVSEIRAITPETLELEQYTDKWVWDDSAASWVQQFADTDDPNNDYGAWSGDFDWFGDIITVGTSAKVLRQSQEDQRAEKYEKDYKIAYDTARTDYPSRRKRMAPPSIVLQTGGSNSGYFDVD